MAGLGDAALVTAAKLVVSELVTNAMLHGGPPVVMRLRPRDHGVRVEVQDGSKLVPMRAIADLDKVVAPLTTEPLTTVLDRILEGVSSAAGGALGDDLALLVAEYRPRAGNAEPMGGS